MQENLSIVVFANAKDFFFTKLCITSIRYFYPIVEIFLVKDELNGKFNSKVLEKKFDVKIIKLSKKFYGWSAAKLHFLIERDENKKYLCLDSDILFLGKVLNKLNFIKADFIVSPEYFELTTKVKEVFIDPSKMSKYYPNYKYPGYFFNGGQTVVNPSKIHQEDFNNIFDKENYPYYLNYDDFKFVDQSILNALLPSLSNAKRIRLEAIEFMKSSAEFFSVSQNNTISILDLNNEYLVHYAGDLREYTLMKMNGKNLLIYFKSVYEKKLNKFEIYQSRIQDFINSIKILTVVKLKFNRVLIETKKTCQYQLK
jgi:hypothetical protein